LGYNLNTRPFRHKLLGQILQDLAFHPAQNLPHRQQQRAELPVKFELLINMKTWELSSRRRSSLRADEVIE